MQECGWVRDEVRQKGHSPPFPTGLGRLSEAVTSHRNSSTVKTIREYGPQNIIKMKIKNKFLGLVLKSLSNMALALEATVPFIFTCPNRTE